jgi:hypothetical protein
MFMFLSHHFQTLFVIIHTFRLIAIVLGVAAVLLLLYSARSGRSIIPVAAQ